MERELLLEIGCEELPASWLTPLAGQLAERLTARLREFRLASDAEAETHATPRRLAAVVPRIAERQSDHEELVSGPPAAAAFRDGQPTPAALGFARKYGVEVAALERVTTPKGEYLAYRARHRGRAAADILPDVLAATLRDLSFPKQMRWDAWIDDGRGELLFGRPIRWLLFLYGGRVVPFTIRRSPLAQSASVQDVRSGAVTHGHRFLAVSGRAGRAVKVRSFQDYKARLAEHFVILARRERQDRLVRELELHARRLGGRVHASAHASAGPLAEVADLVEYPSVVAGTYSAEFLQLPQEVLTTTMIHHQHYFPVVDDRGRLMPAFLAVTNIEVDNTRKIAVNSERVLIARLRDARFFWDADRATRLEDRLDRLDTVRFHRALGSYRDKARRLERLAATVAESLGAPEAAADAARAGLLAKTDLTTDMVREFTELQGTMGGIYAREQGEPDPVWRAIYHHYQPASIDADAEPSRESLGSAAAVWAAVSVADKLDSVVGLFGAGERPTGTRDPFAIRRQVQGVLKVLVDLPEVTGLTAAVDVGPLLAGAAAGYPDGTLAEFDEDLQTFVRDRVKYVFQQRGFRPEEIEAVLGATGVALAPLDLRHRLEALAGMRGSQDFAALAVLFKRVKNIAREVSPVPQPAYEARLVRGLLVEPAEQALLQAFDRVAPAMREAVAARHYRKAMAEAATLRPAVDRFFTEVFVMVEDAALRASRLMLMVSVRDLVLEVADISQLGGA